MTEQEDQDNQPIASTGDAENTGSGQTEIPAFVPTSECVEPKTFALKKGKEAKPVLNKAQRAFQRAKKRVGALQAQLERDAVALEHVLAHFNANVRPLETQMFQKREELILGIGEILFREDKSFTKTQRRKIALTLLEILLGFMNEAVGVSEKLLGLQKRIERFLDDTDGIKKGAVSEAISKANLAGFEDFMGVMREAKRAFATMGVDLDISGFSPDMTLHERMECIRKMEQDMKKRAPEIIADYHAKQAMEADVAPRKKTKKQLEKEEREKAIQEMRQKNINSVYKQLARLFHPDLEPDATKKLEKENLMKELTRAHEAGDLHTILNLEMRWLQKEDADVTALSDAKLDAYTEALKEQARDLEMEIGILYGQERFLPFSRMPPFQCCLPNLLFREVDMQKRQLTRILQSLENEIAQLSMPTVAEFIKEWLKRHVRLRKMMGLPAMAERFAPNC